MISLWIENPTKQLNAEVGSTIDTKSTKNGEGKPNRKRAEVKKTLPLTIVPIK